MAKQIVIQNAPEYDRAMLDWRPVIDLEGGDSVLQGKCETYLPRLRMETETYYGTRVRTAYLDDYFNEGLESIARKPVEQDIVLNTRFVELQEMALNMDGQGTNLSEFFEADLVDVLRYGVVHNLTLLPMLEPTDGEDEEEARPMTMAELRDQELFPYIQRIPPPRLTNVGIDRHGKIAEYAVQHSDMADEQDKGPVEQKGANRHRVRHRGLRGMGGQG